MKNQKGKVALGGIEKDAIKLYFQKKKQSRLKKMFSFHFGFISILLLLSYFTGNYDLLLLGAIFSTITITADSATQFESGGAEYNDIARLSDDKFVIAFRDINDNNKGKVIIGTRSGTTISIVEDSAITFEGGETTQIGICSLDSAHFAISFNDVSESKIKAIVGSVSDTTITLGSVVDIGTPGNAGDICALDDTYFVVLYSEEYTTNCKVCSVSGTTITVGNRQELIGNMSEGQNMSIGALTNTKFVCSYVCYSAGSYKRLRVGTVDINAKTISYGLSESLGKWKQYVSLAVFDENYFIIIYENTASNVNEVRCCNVSGTTITVGNSVQVNSHNAYAYDASVCTMDSTHFVVCYPQTDNADKGTVRGGSIAGTTITLDDDGEIVFENDATDYPKICKLMSNYFIVGFKHG